MNGFGGFSTNGEGDRSRGLGVADPGLFWSRNGLRSGCFGAENTAGFWDYFAAVFALIWG